MITLAAERTAAKLQDHPVRSFCQKSSQEDQSKMLTVENHKKWSAFEYSFKDAATGFAYFM